MYKHIVLAADGSDHSFRAAWHAATLAALSRGCRVTLLFIPRPDEQRGEGLQKDRLAAVQMERREKLSRHEALFSEKEIPYTVAVKDGNPGPVIIKFANEQQADLVILGSRGLNKLQQLVLGSVSHKVMKRANCPVMIVK
ncbi:universal stress protein [Domibacillus indicus]|uniref:universal stress protein n=1 Tax=Domibacillus indicus TaxID=1437523 RepID=UPI000617D22F|nr:universal stress protein [Domibacillus indicus]